MTDIEPQNLDQSIYETRGMLAILLHRIYVQFDIDEYLNEVRADLLAKKINVETMAEELDFAMIRPHENPPYKVHFSHSCIYTVLAMESQGGGRELDSWAFIAQAKYHAGVAMAGINTYFGVDPEAVLKKRARDGGIAKEANNRFDKDEIINILSSPPVGGWHSEEEAIGVVKELLAKKIKESWKSKSAQRFVLNPDDPKDFERKLNRWIKLDKARQRDGKKQGLIRLVYERYSREMLMHPHEVCAD